MKIIWEKTFLRVTYRERLLILVYQYGYCLFSQSNLVYFKILNTQKRIGMI
jgi:hypothetical protein